MRDVPDVEHWKKYRESLFPEWDPEKQIGERYS
jgi:hypothetical protein